MKRDEFSPNTKRTLAQRAGGRCSRPGCDALCWLPGEGPSRAASIGVASHICAASEGGPRYDPHQTPEQRRDISNAIYLCQNHAHEVDTDESRFSVDDLRDWKDKHEAQIIGQAEGKWLLPDISLQKGIGLTVKSETDHHITEETLSNRVEHTLVVKNVSDFEVRRIGFCVQFPEFIEHPPQVTGPPGFDHQIHGENMEWEVFVKGTGSSVTSREVTHYGSFTLEGSSLLQGQQISILMRSIPDPIPQQSDSDKHLFWVSGELSVNIGSILETHKFTSPLFYSSENRGVEAGYVHTTNIESGEYISLRRGY